MPVVVKFNPASQSPQAQLIGDATLNNDGVMTAAQAAKLDGIAPGGVSAVTGTAPISATAGPTPNISISPATSLAPGSMSAADFAKLAGLTPGVSTPIYWAENTPWSTVLDRINAVPAESGVIVMLDAGAYVMDVAADLDRVQFIGMVESPTAEGGAPTTITMTGAFTLLGNFLYLVNIVALSEVTIWDGAGPFRLNLMGSSELTRSYLGTFVPTIKLGAGGVLDVSVSQYSLFGGGNDPTVEMDDGATINFLLTGAGIIGDKTAVLKGGATAAATTMGTDATCVIAGQNGAFGNAFGPGISLSIDKNGNAFFGPYAPTTASDWNAPVPDNIGAALDQCAARLRAGSL